MGGGANREALGFILGISKVNRIKVITTVLNRRNLCPEAHREIARLEESREERSTASRKIGGHEVALTQA